MGRLDGKVAVVTGGGNGIGRACCERFAEEGADVVVADLLEDAAAETATSVSALGRRAVPVAVDVTDPGQVDAAMQRAVDELGGLDVVVTAAGISHAGYRSGDTQGNLERLAANADVLVDPVRSFLEAPLEDLRSVMDVNLVGTLLAVQSGARRMVDRDTGGSIVTIASIAAKVPEAGTVAYGLSKAAVWMLTKQAARVLATSGVRVNSIGPGLITTNLTAILEQIPEARDQFMASTPMGRPGTPREVANTALFLASDESSYFTGEILHPDGGYYTE
jgi:NAD(P)-dependent dehydrogenase (short-subunit alcohol dehydrogenase family)